MPKGKSCQKTQNGSRAVERDLHRYILVIGIYLEKVCGVLTGVIEHPREQLHVIRAGKYGKINDSFIFVSMEACRVSWKGTIMGHKVKFNESLVLWRIPHFLCAFHYSSLLCCCSNNQERLCYFYKCFYIITYLHIKC